MKRIERNDRDIAQDYERADISAGRCGWVGYYVRRDKETNEVRIKQTNFTHSIFLTNKELYKMAKDIYGDLPIKVSPQTWEVNPDNITLEWIKEQIEKLGLSKTDLKKQTGLDRNSLYAILNNTRPLSRANKMIFFYYLHLVNYGVRTREELKTQSDEISGLIRENETLKEENERLKKEIDQLKGEA